MYFNLEPTTMFLIMWTALWLHLLGISMSRIRALFSIRRLSYAALVPGLLTFYPLFYVSDGFDSSKDADVVHPTTFCFNHVLTTLGSSEHLVHVGRVCR